MDRRKLFGGTIGSLVGLAAAQPAAAGNRAGRCEGCNRNEKCRKKFRCVQNRCVPRTVELVCGGAYQKCQNGRYPECVDGVAVCPGKKPATPYC